MRVGRPAIPTTYTQRLRHVRTLLIRIPRPQRHICAPYEPPILPVMGCVQSGFDPLCFSSGVLLREEESDQAVDVFFAQ